MAYFSQFPKGLYDLKKDGNSKVVVDLMRRVKIKSSIIDEVSLYDLYDIIDGDTPESLAFKIYGDSELHYIILLTNNILDRYYIPIQFKYPFVSLGGSIPLILNKQIPFRPIKDIDIISTQFISKAEIKHEIFGYPLYEIGEEIFNISEYRLACNKPFTQGVGLDIFVNPKATYYYVKFKDLKLRISPPEEIIQFKFKGYSSGEKTNEDLKSFFTLL